MVNIRMPPNNFNIFMPVNCDVTKLGEHKYMKRLKTDFDSCAVILCYCSKCVRKFFIHNDYNQLIRFTHAMVTKLSKNIKDELQRKLILSHYAIISTKEGIISDMVKAKGTLGLNCPSCLYTHFMDYLDAMNQLKKDTIITNDTTQCIMTKELIEKELILIDDLFKPLFFGYVTNEQLKEMIGTK